jgi:hypothetical protein
LNATTTDPPIQPKRRLESNVVTFDRLCKLLGVDSWNKVSDQSIDYYSQWWDKDATDEENEKTAMEAETDHFRRYYDAVTGVAEDLFGSHGLVLVGKSRTRKPVDRPWEFRVVPKVSWEDAADHIRMTINGVGIFEFSTLREFLDSGPYTGRRAVLGHLGWIPSWFEVYGEGKARQNVERRMR